MKNYNKLIATLFVIFGIMIHFTECSCKGGCKTGNDESSIINTKMIGDIFSSQTGKIQAKIKKQSDSKLEQLNNKVSKINNKVDDDDEEEEKDINKLDNEQEEAEYNEEVQDEEVDE